MLIIALRQKKREGREGGPFFFLPPAWEAPEAAGAAAAEVAEAARQEVPWAMVTCWRVVLEETSTASAVAFLRRARKSWGKG